jgi:glycerol-3-phosphate acyltransferase PlsY
LDESGLLMAIAKGGSMQPIFLAYGEGQFASTATGVTLGVLAAVLFCVFLVLYASSTYPANRP